MPTCTLGLHKLLAANPKLGAQNGEEATCERDTDTSKEEKIGNVRWIKGAGTQDSMWEDALPTIQLNPQPISRSAFPSKSCVPFLSQTYLPCCRHQFHVCKRRNIAR